MKMREFVVLCVILCTVVMNVQSKSIFRNGRELQEPQEIPEPVPVDLEQPVLLVKEEMLVPFENLQNLEQGSGADEPVAILVEDSEAGGEEGQASQDDQPPNEEGQLYEAEDGLRGDTQIGEQEYHANPAELNNEEKPSVDLFVLKQGTSSTARPSLIEAAQQIINNNPLGQFIDSIRRPSTKAPDGAEAAVEATTNANIFQQIQAGVQSIGSQITSAFTPPQNALQPQESSPAETVVRPPNFFEQLQSNIQNTVQGIFRPNTEQNTAAVNPQQGPFQAVLSNVQSFLTGNRGEVPAAAQTSSSPAPPKVDLPVDDKVDFSKNSGEAQEDLLAAGSEPIAAVNAADPLNSDLEPQKEDSEEGTVVLVAHDSSLEHE